MALNSARKVAQFTGPQGPAGPAGPRGPTGNTGTSYTAPTGTGFPHIASGVQDAAARAVNLASADVTGVLPITNGGVGTIGADATHLISQGGGMASWVAASGDVTLNDAGLYTVVSISGASPISITPNSLQWITGATGPLLTQPDTSGVTCAPFTVHPQKSTNGNGNGASFIFDLNPHTAGGSAGGVYVKEAGTEVFRVDEDGDLVGAATSFRGGFRIGLSPYSTGHVGITLGATTQNSNTTNLDGDANTTNLNANTTVNLNIGNTLQLVQIVNFARWYGVTVLTPNGVQINNSSADFGSGVGVLAIANGTAPSANPSSSGVLWFNSGAQTTGTPSNGLLCRVPGGAIECLAPKGDGTQNSQLGQFPMFAMFGRTAGVGQTVTQTIVIPQGATMQISLSVVGRVVTAGGTASVGDSFGYYDVLLVKNISGVLTVVGGLPTAIFSKSDTSQASDTVTTGTATNAITLIATQAGATNTGTIDWQMNATCSLC